MSISETKKQMNADKSTVLRDFPKARAVQIPRHLSWRIYFNVFPRGIDDGCCIYCNTEAEAWAEAAKGCRTDRAWVAHMKDTKNLGPYVQAQLDKRKGVRAKIAGMA